MFKIIKLRPHRCNLKKEAARMKRAISFMLCLSLIFSGCGTLVHGTSQNIPIQSDPPGAKARLSNGYEITTPDTVTVKREDEQVITFEKEGYKKKQVMLNRHFNAGATILGNILWLLVGAAVDLIAGGAWTLKPEAVHVTLEKA